MMGYYDAVLGLIPASLLGLTSFLSVVGVPTTIALLVASFVTVGIIGHAMFVRTPTTDTNDPSRNPSTSPGLQAD